MTIPYGYQLESVKQIEFFNGRTLLALEPGLGKSFTTLLWAKQHPEARPIVVVCPAAIKWVWEDEAKRHVGWRATVLEGTKPRERGLHVRTPLYVVNYDVLHAWLPWLQALEPKLIVLDEVHYAATRSSRRSKACKALCRGVPHVLGLSGTPLTSRPENLWHVLHLIRPDLYPTFWPYAHEFCRPRRTPWGWNTSGANNLKELHRVLRRGVMVRFRKQDVLQDLPPKRRTVVPVDIGDQRNYQKALGSFLSWLRENAPGKAETAAKAQGLVQLGFLLRLTAKLKLPAVFEWVDDFLAGGDAKLALYGIHRSIVRGALHERYPDISVVVDGQVTGKRRKLAFDQFLKGKRTRLLLGNVRAAGVGLSGRGVSDMAFVEFPWTPGELVQAEDRFHGVGRGRPDRRTHVRFLAAHGTVEEKLLRALQRKQRVLNQTLDGDGRGDALDVYDMLCKSLLKGDER